MLAIAMLFAQLASATPAELVAGIDAYYSQHATLQAGFTQVFTSAVTGKPRTSKGVLMVARPGRMRWDYLTPVRTLYVSDGKLLWVYEPAQRQAFQQPLAGAVQPLALSFLAGQGALARDFVASAGAPQAGAVVVELVPRQPTAQLARLTLVCDPGDFHVLSSIVVDAAGNVNRFTFDHVKTDAQATAVKPEVFRFKPPPGTHLIKP